MIHCGGVYTTSAKRRAYFGKSIAIEMGGVSRYFSEVLGVKGRFDSPGLSSARNAVSSAEKIGEFALAHK